MKIYIFDLKEGGRLEARDFQHRVALNCAWDDDKAITQFLQSQEQGADFMASSSMYHADEYGIPVNMHRRIADLIEAVNGPEA